MSENNEEQESTEDHENNLEQETKAEEEKKWASWLVGEIEDYLSKHKNVISLTRSVIITCLVSLIAACIECELVAKPLQPIHTFIVKLIWPLISFSAKSFFRIIGLAISISLALGFASHVQDALDYSLVHAGAMKKNASKANTRQSTLGQFKKSDLSVQHDMSYYTLMASAGYSVDTSIPLRGQHAPEPAPHPQKNGVDLMNSLFPTLPRVVRKELGEIVDLVVRDFVASWFCNMQVGPSSPDGCKSLASTTIARNHPFLVTVSASMAHVIGRLCTLSAENINVMELLLVHVVKCLSSAVNIYRKMKKRAILRSNDSKKRGLSPRSSTSNTSLDAEQSFEVAVAREFLLAGHVHKAITFGVDLKALFYGDGNLISVNELHDMLFKSSLFIESEQDYNRVLAHRLCRKLLLQSDLNSTPLRAFAVESIATCLLGPIMACWTPEYMNFGIVKGLQMMQTTADLSDESAHDSTVIDDETDFALDSESSGQNNVQSSTKSENEQNQERSSNTPIAPKQPLDATSIGASGIVVETTEPHSSADSVQTSQHEQKPLESGQKSIIPSKSALKGVHISPSKKHGEEDVTMNSLLSAPPTELPIGIENETETIVENINPNEVFSEENQYMSEERSEFELNENIEPRLDILANHEGDTYATDDIENHPIKSSGGVSDADNELSCAHILPLATLAVAEMQTFVNTEEHKNEDGEVDWMDKTVRTTVCQLVLVIEAAMRHGRVKNSSTKNVSLSMVLMDMTTNILEFQKKVLTLGESYFDQFENQDDKEEKSDDDAIDDSAKADPSNEVDDINSSVSDDDDVYAASPDGGMFADESSTFRTLIAAWLQTGDIYSALKVLSSTQILLEQFYSSNAFLRTTDLISMFLLRLKPLDYLTVLVDTMSVLAADALSSKELLNGTEEADEKVTTDKSEDVVKEKKDRRGELSVQQQGSFSNIMQKLQGNKDGNSNIGMAMKSGLLGNKLKFTKWVGFEQPPLPGDTASKKTPAPDTASKSVTISESKQFAPNVGLTAVGSGSIIPTHLDFHSNASLTSKLRLERERRLDSWRKANVATFTTQDGKYRMIDMIHSPKSRVIHKELHSLARQFVSNTFKLALKGDEKNQDKQYKNHKILLEYLSGRRVMDIPDDDSGFLLRAQQRALDPIGVHVDQRNHEQTYKCFVSSYEEPIMNRSTNRYSGGRYLHYCLLKYFPSDRTAALAPFQNDRFLCKEFLLKRDNAALPEKLRNQRRLCQKAQQRNVTGSVSLVPSNVLASNVMDSSDFCSLPRTGKAVDFIYRIPFYEKPQVELAGKRFTINDGSRTGPHRADASCLELSDASLSVTLILRSQLVCTGVQIGNSTDNSSSTSSTEVTENNRQDSTPLIYMKVSSQKRDNGQNGNDVEIKGFRPSHIRAALMIASARQDAQLQCLTWCVRSGSARKATKARIEAILQPSLTILDFASGKHEKESILVRDLKLGINHIDREHLRRNDILNPRYPTVLRGLNAKVESWSQGSISESASSTLFKIRCVALSEVIYRDNQNDILDTSTAGNNATDSSDTKSERQVYRLEWNVYRQFREILAFHKHIKSQVSSFESGAGPKFFTAGIMPQRKGLVPSLANAAKGGPLGASTSQRALEKRRDALNEYFGQLLSRNHLLKRSPELLKFIGADKAFTPEIEGLEGSVRNNSDVYGRKNIKITRLNANNFPEVGASSKPTTVTVAVHGKDTKSNSEVSNVKQSLNHNNSLSSQKQNVLSNENSDSLSETKRKTDGAISKSIAEKKYADRMRMAQIASVKSRIDRIRLSSVRNSIFDLIRSLFDLDAYVFRSRLMSAIRTMSFVITNSQDFSQLLLDSHLAYVNGDSIGDIVQLIRETLWPEGVFKTSAKEDPEKNFALKKESLEALSLLFPDQLRRLLGQEITQEGLTLIHEMFQNRVIAKSLGYIIIDIVLLSIFPDFSDLLDGTEVLDSSTLS